VTQSELVGLFLITRRDAVDETNESLLFDLGISLTIERFLLLILTGATVKFSAADYYCVGYNYFLEI